MFIIKLKMEYWFCYDLFVASSDFQNCFDFFICFALPYIEELMSCSNFIVINIQILNNWVIMDFKPKKIKLTAASLFSWE